VVARHADCLAVLRDRRASSDSTKIPPDRLPEGFRRAADPDDPVVEATTEMRPFLFRDPPDHTRLRGLVAKAFTPRVVEGFRARTREVVDELVDAALEAGQVDLIEALAYPLPVRIICDLLGVPVEDQERFKGWSQALARGLDPDFLLSDDVVADRLEAITEFAGYFFDLLAERRRNPGDDLLSGLVRVEEAGSTLTEGELLSTCILLLVAGHETTVNLIAGGVLALLRDPDQRAVLAADPGLDRSATEELLRHVSPVQLTGRTMLEPVEVDGVTFDAGDFVMLLVASANHDPEAFDHPDRLDLGRSPNNHLGFGFGIHHCLGAPLARLECQIALRTLLTRAPDLALAVDDVVWKRNVVLRGMEALPVAMRG
jgi:unspecific monooxygenase